ncbi:MAG TPA: DciA family protein [Holophagaceae bacterium]|nr:DciA family protein [Holophagaceae bacterium]
MRGLHPLSNGLRGRLAPEPARLAEARLREAWPFAVGPLLARRTRLLRLHRGRLVVGCWELAAIPSLRLAAEAAWPSVQERLTRAFGIHLSAIEISPCDPPEAKADPAPAEDPLRELLLKWRIRKA